MNDIESIRSGIEVKLLRVERDRADALAGIVEQCLDHLATIGEPDRAAETAMIEARACLASALRRDDGRSLAALLTETRDVLDACRTVLDMEPTEWAMPIVAQIERFKAGINRREADHALEVDGLRAEIERLKPGPWRTPEEEAPPRGEWIAVVMAEGFPYTVQLSERQPIDWMRHWRRLPADLLKAPVTT